MLTPYFSVPLGWQDHQLEIKEIIVGPCPHRDEAMNSVQMLLKKESIRGAEVKDCKIPYRNW